jgi:opacity protein-like surface antigen
MNDLKKLSVYKIALIVTAALITTPNNLFASDGFYTSLGAGYGSFDDSSSSEYDAGVSLNAAIGKRINENIRLEAEIVYQMNSYDTGTSVDVDLRAMSFLLNGLYDIDIKQPVTPYVGAGFGFTDVDIEASSSSSSLNDSTSAFAWNIQLGLSMPIGSGDVFASYQYISTADLEFDAGTVEGGVTNNFRAGYRYNF